MTDREALIEAVSILSSVASQWGGMLRSERDKVRALSAYVRPYIDAELSAQGWERGGKGWVRFHSAEAVSPDLIRKVLA